ncbi:TIGR01777 family oxidoreductase [Mucilaginibacter koreensis]
MQQHILITGGNGLIGKHLTQALLQQGHKVSHLSRHPTVVSGVTSFKWDLHRQQIDMHCIDGVDTIVHLAGAGVADKRWTEKRKKEILDSRTQSIRLIYTLLQQKEHQVKSVVSASATGYYGSRNDEVLTESSAPSDDFLGKVCVEWENAVDKGKALGLRIVKFRTGVVLTTEGGALPPLAAPVKLGLGAPLGNGRQWIPWIHWQDVVDQYLMAINKPEMEGVFNMSAPEPVTNRQLTEAVAHQLKKPLWLPAVPAFALKLAFGEMSEVVLGSTRAIPEALKHTSYQFKYPTIAEALKEIYGS